MWIAMEEAGSWINKCFCVLRPKVFYSCFNFDAATEILVEHSQVFGEGCC